MKYLLTIPLLLLTLSACTPSPTGNLNADNTNINMDVQNDEIDTSTWKTYRNEEYGFELRYPSELQFSTAYSQGVPAYSFTLNKDHGFYVFPKGEFDYGLGELKEKESTTVGGREGTIYDYGNYLIIKLVGDKNFRIEITYKTDNVKKVLMKVLDSFIFIK